MIHIPPEAAVAGQLSTMRLKLGRIQHYAQETHDANLITDLEALARLMQKCQRRAARLTRRFELTPEAIQALAGNEAGK